MIEEINPPKQEAATENYLKDSNPHLWQEISLLTPEDRYNHWLELVQKHLVSYEEQGIRSDNFKQEELELLYLNTFFDQDVPTIDSNFPITGGVYQKEGTDRFKTFGQFTDRVKEELNELENSANILITGLGISGKATIRSILAKALQADKRVISWDRDYQKIFPPILEGDVNIIEDVHGLDRGKEGELIRFNGEDGLQNGYDLVIYCLPSRPVYWQSLLNRGRGWVEQGKIDLTQTEEKGLNNEERIEEAADKLEEIKEASKELMVNNDFPVLKEIREQGASIIIINPKEIFRKLYGLQVDTNLLDQSFIEPLKKEFLEA